MKIDKEIIDLIIRNLSELEVLILALLNAKNREPIKSGLFFQKEIFLVLNYIKEMLPNADFISHTLGPYSEVAEKSMNNLNSYDLVEKIEEGYKLTGLGIEIFKEFKGKLSKNKLEAIEDFKDFLNDLTRDELLVFTYVSFPKFTTESGIKDEIYSKRKPSAVSLYKKGKVSLEKAAFLSGLSLEEFTKYLVGGS